MLTCTNRIQEAHLDQEVEGNTLSWVSKSLEKGEPKCPEGNGDRAHLFRNF